MKDDGDSPFKAYYKQCNMHGTRILFNQVPSAQNLIETTLIVVVGVK